MKRYESSRGRDFSQEELEDLPQFDVENMDHDAWLEYENEHGISPDEVHAFMDELEEDVKQEYGVDIMIDSNGQPYEQFKLDLSDDDLEDLNTSSKGIEQ